MARPRNLGYGEGTVYFEKSTNRWRGELRLATGERRRVSGANRSDVTTELDKLRIEIANGQALGDDTRLDQWIEWWLENIVAKKSPKTADHKRWAIGQLTAITRKRLRDLTVADVEAELGRLARRPPSKRHGRGGNRGPLGQSSLVKVRQSLAEVLTMAERRKMVVGNVAKLAELPVGAKLPKPQRSLTFDEAKRFAESAKGHRQQALVLLLLHNGLRPGEVAGLPWSAVDLNESAITIHQNRQALPDGTMVIGPTKAHSDRNLRIAPIVANAVRQHKARQARERLAAEAWIDQGLVFTNEVGGLLDPSNLRRVVTRICRSADIEPLSPYGLRHSAASLLVAMGANLEDVADMLGHKDVRMLAQVYRHRVKRVVDLTELQAKMLGGDDKELPRTS